MADPEYDLLLSAGRVVCPASGIDSAGAVAIRGDRIVAAGPHVGGDAKRTFDFPDGILLPGLIDLHAHPAKCGSVFGVDPDAHMLPRGTTTVLSQGDAGAANIDEYVRNTIEATHTRVRLAINLSRAGESTAEGCFEYLEWIDVDACVDAAQRHREHVWGIAVNVSRNACGATDPREVLTRGLRAAERTGLPLLYGMRPPDEWPFDEQLQRLRPGDLVTYCCRREPHCIVEANRVHPAIRAARERGILFDVGHGTASFDFGVAETAIADGFLPDTISTDLQANHVGRLPPHDLPLVMSKLIAAGMLETDVFAAVTYHPATVLRMADEIGTLRADSCADVSLLGTRPTNGRLVDTSGQARRGTRLEAALTVRAGRVHEVDHETA